MWTFNSFLNYRTLGSRAAGCMVRVLGQQQPAAPPAVPFDVHVDLSGLADLIWRALVDHLDEVGTAVWAGVRDHLGEIGQAIWAPLSQWLAAGLQNAVKAVWNATFGAVANIFGQLPPEWTYDNPVYRVISTDPLPVATGGAMLAVVLLGLRTVLGSMVGRDHVITHISGRLIPAVFLTLAYPFLIVRGVQLLNAAASAVGTRAAVSTLVDFPQFASAVTDPTIMALWVVLLWYGMRLLLRVTYSLVRFVVALVFGPVALILWAIPQTEWVTWFWLRELIGWGTTPLLVAVCLSVAVRMATGRDGFLAAAAFGIAGFMAAYDMVGLLGLSQGMGRGRLPLGYLRAAVAASAGPTNAAWSATTATRMSILADMYGYQ